VVGDLRVESASWSAYAGGRKVGGCLLALLGAIALTGRVTGATPIFVVRPGLSPIASSSAFLFALLGVGLCLASSTSTRVRLSSRALVVTALVIAAAHVVGEAAHIDLEPSFLLALRQRAGLAGSMSLLTAACFVVACVALLEEGRATPSRATITLARMLSATVALIGLGFSLGYMYRAPLVYNADTPVALPTAIMFLVLGLSLVIPASLREQVERRQVDRDRALIDGAFEHSAIGMALVAPDGRWLRVNPGLCKLVGFTEQELLATTFQAITHPADVDADIAAVRHMLAGELQSRQVEKRYVTKQGESVWVLLSETLERDATGRPLYFISQMQDTTERKKAEEAVRVGEEQLRRSQRLEAVGQLAGGVAHDFNNLLNVIMSYTALLREQMEPTDPRGDDVHQIDKAATRAATLTRQLLAFSRRQILRPQAFGLNRTITDLEPMLRPLLAEDIKLVTTLDPNLRCVCADPGQIEQVLMNLVVNARDAMPDGGTVSITTANVELDDAHAARHPTATAPPGQYVMLAVSDTGCGMDGGTQAKMFEPFFTTKEQGKGTGLGLSTVYGIVKQSGGAIWCYSEPGLGTTFKVFLPSTDGIPDGGANDELLTGNADHTSGGSETVLVVEDDEAVRHMVRRILTERGYRVQEAGDGASALRVWEESSDPIDLIVTDIVMPELGGPELARRVHARHPRLPILYMSGYTEDAALRQSFLERDTPFIQKPFAPRALAKCVRDILDRSRSDT
jgi:two-component system, cell cycle sensor histidine kinase and response regulator CckA